MPEKKYTQRIPESKWNFHKATIFRLYVTENKPLTAPGGVKDIMSTEHNFSATKPQYEIRLKKWGFRKYACADHRLAQAQVLSNYRAEGQETEQHTRGPDNAAPAETCPLSRGIAIRTPSPHRPALQPAPLSLISPVISSSALARGRQGVSSASASSATSNSPLFCREVESLFSQDHRWASNENLGANNPFEVSWNTFINENTSLADGLIGWNDPRPSSSNSFLAGFSPSATILSGKFSIPDFVTSIMPVISRMFRKAGSVAHLITLGDSSALESAIRSISHPSTLQLVRQQNIDHQVIYMIFHRLVNDGNAVRALDEPETKLDHLFKAGIMYCFSLGEDALGNIIDSTPSPYKTALIQNMFCAALIMGHGPVLKTVLDMDQDNLANRPFFAGGLQCYPLHYTSFKGHVRAVEVLLDHGAQLTQLQHGCFSPNGTWMGPWFPSGNTEDKFQTMQLFLGRGLKLSPLEAMHLVEHCDRNTLPLLLTHSLDNSFDIFFQLGALPHVLLRSDWDDSLSKMIRDILYRAHSDGIGHLDIWDLVLSESLSSAVLRRHTSAVNILLDMGAEPDVSCLISAVQSEGLEVLERFLDLGLDPNTQMPELLGRTGVDYERDHDCTALSQSIHMPSRRAFEVLHARGFVSQLVDRPAGFASALVAACQVGDSPLVQELLSLQNPLTKPNITEALEAAVQGNRYQIIKLLLSAGIRSTIHCIELAVRNKHLEAFQLLSHYMDQPDMLLTKYGWHYGIIFDALRWGEPKVIEHLLQIEHPVNVLQNIKQEEFGDWNLGLQLKSPGSLGHWSLTPLSAAILKRNSRAVKPLMAYGALVVLSHTLTSQFASQQYMVPPLVESSSIAEWTLTPLAAGAVTHDLPLIKEFLRIGADPFDNSALFVCAVLGMEDIANLLLSAFKIRYPDGAQSFGSDALSQSVRNNDVRMLELLAKNADITGRVRRGHGDKWHVSSRSRLDTVFTSPLGEAIRVHSACGSAGREFDLLLPLVKDLNAVVHRDYKRGSMTSLIYAIALKSLETVRKLAQAGANISLPAVRSIRRTPLQAAAEAGSEDIVNYFLGEGVSPNEPPAARAGATALQLAAIKGHIGIATILLNAGAEINAQAAPIDGRTAFEGATEHGRIDMMLFLVRHGADLLSNDQEQYRRAVELAEDNLQYAAIKFADDLLKEALSNNEQASLGWMEMGGLDTTWMV